MPLPPKVHKRFSWRGQLFPAGLFSKLPGWYIIISMAIPHNSKCRYGERGAADTKPKAQIILDAAKVSAASGGNSEPKQGQRSQSARGFCPRSTMRVPQPDIIEHFGNADAVPQLPERCLSRKAGIVRCCHNTKKGNAPDSQGAFPFYFLTYPFMSLYAFHSGAKSNRYRVVAL